MSRSTPDTQPAELVSAAAEVAALFRQYYWLSRGWPEVQRLVALTAPPSGVEAVDAAPAAPASAAQPAADLPFTDTEPDAAVTPRTRFIPDGGAP